MNFDAMAWVVTVTPGHTYGPLTKDGAVELRDGLRVVAPSKTIEAWAAQVPDTRIVKKPEQAWQDVA